MRQPQQNKRIRGRGRKNPGSQNKTFESNGPDVKIRGTAAHVAEKYASLSRDAQASGDYVASENYLQHAEHYLRIVASFSSPNQNSAGANNRRGQNGSASAERAAQSEIVTDTSEEAAEATVVNLNEDADAAEASDNDRTKEEKPRKTRTPRGRGRTNGSSANGKDEHVNGEAVDAAPDNVEDAAGEALEVQDDDQTAEDKPRRRRTPRSRVGTTTARRGPRKTATKSKTAENTDAVASTDEDSRNCEPSSEPLSA